MNIRNKNIFRTLIAGILCAAYIPLFTACEDDFEVNSGEIPEGIGSISMQMDFAPLAEGLTESRATVAPDGNAINGIKDLCILFYDKDGNLLEDYVYYYNTDEKAKPKDLPDNRFISGSVFKDVDRNNEDASNGKLAQEKSMTGTFNSLKVPFGQYTVIGVANLGNSKSIEYEVATTTYDELFNNSNNDPSTIDGVRGIRLKWDSSSISNNAEMFGCFTDDEQTSADAADFFNKGTLPTVIVNKDGMKLVSWLRRAASKVTIEFDGTNLRDNIWIHLKSVTIKDIPMGCDLGRKHMVTEKDSLIPVSSHHIDYTPDGKEDYANFESWPTVVRNRKYPDTNPHGETVKSLFFYENMQGTGDDKRQYPELGPDGKPTGNVKDFTKIKDNKPCGTYIEVEAFYRSRADNVSSHGKIIYRFMLGKDVIMDYNAERNYHYKLTLRFNGNANDYDWHIDYNEDPGIKVPIPYYYIPYMYNQSMTFPVTIVGEIEGNLKAEIIRSDWGPSTKDKPGEPVTGFEYYKGNVVDDGPWHGFLSLRKAPSDTGGGRELQSSIGIGFDASGNQLTNSIGTDEYKYSHWVNNPTYGKQTLYNHAYWDGHGDSKIFEKVNPRGVREYNPTVGQNNGDDTDGRYSVDIDEKNGRKYTTFNIPLYSREINLVKTAGYRGNNPYIGYYRYAEIRFTAKIKGKSTPDTVISRLLQVPRIVNPKGIYRSWDTTKSFNVHLMRLDSEYDDEYTPVTSDGGPWSAEIEYITESSGWLSVGGKTVVGQKIHGTTGSQIQFDVAFNSTTGDSKKVRCAVIKVLYHNYTCTHRIMVRQGSEPVKIDHNPLSNVKWHISNLNYYDATTNTAHEGASPLEGGSLFRYGNTTQAIASTNNRFEDEYGVKDEYILAPANASPQKKATWDDIKTNKTAAFKNFSPKCQGRPETAKCRVATFNDFQSLRATCDFGAGILYGDNATETATSTAKARGYATYNTDNTGYGMRGWFVYNTKNGGMNLFFPIGVSGNGHRKHGWKYADSKGSLYYSDEKGILRYAARSAPMQDGTGDYAEYRPLLYTMYTQRGAVYWLAGSNSSHTAWDINYSTFDFNTYNTDATELYYDTDAAYIRLVEE